MRRFSSRQGTLPVTRPALRMLAAACCLAVASPLLAQSHAAPPANPGPMLRQGTEHLETPGFRLALTRSSQTVAALEPKGAHGFDFTPGDRLIERSTDGYYHLGDIDLRLRTSAGGPWQDYSSAFHRQPVKALPVKGDQLASADLTATFPAGMPLRIVRTWRIDGENLALHFTLTNTSAKPVMIGALGIPLIFNNILSGRTLAQASVKCSFDDPYIGEDAGYVQVTRLNGHGPALVVVPEAHTPLEAWRPILNHRGANGEPLIFNDPTPRGITFEGFYEWMVYSRAYQLGAWKGADPWNPGTSLTLKPGESRSFGLKFLLSPSIPQVQQTLIDHFRPVAAGFPGYVLPQDIHAQLFLHYHEPVRSITVEPAGAIAITTGKSTSTGWLRYNLQGRQWGRARVVVTYQDGTVQSIGYFVIKPEQQAVADLGHFLTTKQWFVDPNDPFHRSPSVITYDGQANRQVTQEGRVWIAGLSDEAGAGSWLAAAMKEFGQPDKQEIEKYQEFVDHVLWGSIQYSSGPLKYGVRKSVFYYQPSQFPAGFYSDKYNWKTWTSWNRKQSEAVDRSFNYPHVAAAYWVMYRLARDHQGLVTGHDWQWYLNHAYQTTMAMMRLAPYYTQFGQMEGDIFLRLLKDLQREGWTQQAATLKNAMHQRALVWDHKAYPFGSEMPWDSTGQEEVYAWTHYFGFEDKAQVTLDAILGYDPSIPSWGYNGSARRYWDFLFAGKIPRIERQLHHYGSGINAIPLLAAYREHPKNLYLLRVGYGGTMGPLTNIDQRGFASEAFHSFPSTMKFDPYSGDYGPNFFGFALDTATYVTHSSTFGWLSFGGNLTQHAQQISVEPLDAFRRRIYLAPFGLWLTLDAGKFRQIRFDTQSQTVQIELDPASAYTKQALLRVEQPASVSGIGRFRPETHFEMVRGAYAVSLHAGLTQMTLRAIPAQNHSQPASASQP